MTKLRRPSTGARSCRPTSADHLATMDRAARESNCGVPWQLLAAIARVESDFGRNMATSSAGAIGYGQFLPSSWQAFGSEGNAYDYRDALPAIALYLCQSGLARDPRAALFAYNHADWYVDLVLDLAVRYDRLAPGAPTPDVLGVGPGAAGRRAAALRRRSRPAAADSGPAPQRRTCSGWACRGAAAPRPIDLDGRARDDDALDAATGAGWPRRRRHYSSRPQARKTCRHSPTRPGTPACSRCPKLARSGRSAKLRQHLSHGPAGGRLRGQPRPAGASARGRHRRAAAGADRLDRGWFRLQRPELLEQPGLRPADRRDGPAERVGRRRSSAAGAGVRAQAARYRRARRTWPSPRRPSRSRGLSPPAHRCRVVVRPTQPPTPLTLSLRRPSRGDRDRRAGERRASCPGAASGRRQTGRGSCWWALARSASGRWRSGCGALVARRDSRLAGEWQLDHELIAVQAPHVATVLPRDAASGEQAQP